MPDSPNLPEPDTSSGMNSLLDRLTHMVSDVDGSFVQLLPSLLVLRGGMLFPASPAAQAEAPQPAAAVVDVLLTKAKAVLLGNEGHHLPDLLLRFLSAILLRMKLSEDAGRDVGSVAHPEQLEEAALSIIQTGQEEPRAGAMLTNDPEQVMRRLADMRFLKEVLQVLRWPVQVVEGGLREAEGEVAAFVRTAMNDLSAIENKSPRAAITLRPARDYISRPAEKGQETKRVKEQAREEGRVQGRAEEAARQNSARGQAVAQPAQPAVTINAAPPAPAGLPAGRPDVLVSDASEGRGRRR